MNFVKYTYKLLNRSADITVNYYVELAERRLNLVAFYDESFVIITPIQTNKGHLEQQTMIIPLKPELKS